MNETKATQAQTLVGVRLPADVAERLKAEARADDRPVSRLARRFIIDGLERLTESDPRELIGKT